MSINILNKNRSYSLTNNNSYKIHLFAVFIILLGFLLRLINLSKNPFYFVDEELYATRAWSLMRYGSIEIYPLAYDYDHPFLGWIIIRFLYLFTPQTEWMIRARMVMVYLGTLQLIVFYLMVRHLFSPKTQLFLLSILSFTNLYITLSRMVLLDNIAIIFLILSIERWISPNISERKSFVQSIIFFSLTVWVKETFWFFSLGFLFLKYFELKWRNYSINPVTSPKSKVEDNFLNIHGNIEDYKQKLKSKGTKNFDNLINFEGAKKKGNNPIENKINSNKIGNNKKEKSKSFNPYISTIRYMFKWYLSVLLIFSLWFVFAAIRDELWIGQSNHGVFSKIFLQMSRGLWTPFWKKDGFFLSSLNYFWSQNPVIIVFISIIIIWAVFLDLFRFFIKFKNKKHLMEIYLKYYRFRIHTSKFNRGLNNLVELIIGNNYYLKKIIFSYNKHIILELPEMNSHNKGDIVFLSERIYEKIIFTFLFSYTIFLLRGGIVFYFYFIPLIPFMVISNVLLPFYLKETLIWFSYLKEQNNKKYQANKFKLQHQSYNRKEGKIDNKKRKMNKRKAKRKSSMLKSSRINSNKMITERRSAIISIILLCFLTSYPFTFNYLWENRNYPIIEANNWAFANIHKDDVVITDCLHFIDFYESGYPHIYLYWRAVSYEPILNQTVFHGDWRSIDYFILTKTSWDILLTKPYQIENVTYQALIHSTLIKTFGDEPNTIYILQVNKSLNNSL